MKKLVFDFSSPIGSAGVVFTCFYYFRNYLGDVDLFWGFVPPYYDSSRSEVSISVVILRDVGTNLSDYMSFVSVCLAVNDYSY